MTIARGLLVAFSTVVLAGSLSCRSRGTGAPARPNVLLISIDTLRADHVGAYGYPHRTTPFLDELAEAGVRFSVARSPSSWTAPSLATLLTGVLPRVHGVEHGWMNNAWIGGQESLPEALQTLAEGLAAAGYRTYGLSANAHASASRGFGAGFDVYRDLPFVSVEELRPDWNDLLEQLRRDRERDSDKRPWFVWVHLFDPHAPYLPYAPFVDETWPAGTARHDDLASVLVAQDFDARELSGSERRYMTTLYDSEIRRTDDFIREMFRALDADENTVTAIVADHGEQFGEHGFHGHSQHLYEGSVRIPFLLHHPSRLDPRVIETPVDLADVLPTVHELVGIDVPPEIDGRSVVALLEEGRHLRRTLFGSLRREEDLHMTVTDRFKLIEERTAGWTLLFDLRDDPGETEDLSSERPELVETLSAARSAYLEAHPPLAGGDAVPLSEQERERLEALGYVN